MEDQFDRRTVFRIIYGKKRKSFSSIQEIFKKNSYVICNYRYKYFPKNLLIPQENIKKRLKRQEDKKNLKNN